VAVFLKENIMTHKGNKKTGIAQNAKTENIGTTGSKSVSSEFKLSIAEKITAPAKGRSRVDVLTAPDRSLL
jgi:hypothetical protein